MENHDKLTHLGDLSTTLPARLLGLLPFRDEDNAFFFYFLGLHT